MTGHVMRGRHYSSNMGQLVERVVSSAQLIRARAELEPFPWRGSLWTKVAFGLTCRLESPINTLSLFQDSHPES